MSKLTHLDDQGAAHMVDVGTKGVTRRQAVATAVGAAGRATLAANFVRSEQWLSAAKVEWASCAVAPGGTHGEDGDAASCERA